MDLVISQRLIYGLYDPILQVIPKSRSVVSEEDNTHNWKSEEAIVCDFEWDNHEGEMVVFDENVEESESSLDADEKKMNLPRIFDQRIVS